MMTDSATLAHGLFDLKQLKKPENRQQNIQIIRTLSQVAYQGNSTAVCRVLGNFLAFISTKDERHGVQLQMNGYWEMGVTEVIAKLLNPQMTVLDVGANYGYFSFLMAALVGPKGQVYSIEANPFIFKFLQKSIKVNGFKNRMTLINKAITDKDSGLQSFVYNNQTPMNGSLQENKAPHTLQDKFTEQVDIETTSLDLLLPDTQVDLMKIDVEGSEEKLWYGSQQLRTANPAMKIVMEFNKFRYNNPLKFIENIFEQGYEVQKITASGTVPMTAVDLTNSSTAQHMMLLLSKA